MDDYLSQANQLYDRIQAQYDANNAWSAEQAQKAMDYQTEMSNTAHQREVADLKAAGLNPVLSAGGSGATTGSGIQAQRSDSNIEALYGLVSKAFEANIKQAEMMAATAKSAGSGSGIGTGYLVDPNSLSTVDQSLLAVAQWLKKRYGIDVDLAYNLLLDAKGNVKNVLNYLGFDFGQNEKGSSSVNGNSNLSKADAMALYSEYRKQFNKAGHVMQNAAHGISNNFPKSAVQNVWETITSVLPHKYRPYKSKS